MTPSDKRRRNPHLPDTPAPWRAPLVAAQVPETGEEIALSADEATRAAIAEVAEVDHIDRLEAQFSVARHGQAGLRVTGTVSASVGQTCVVTLEPMTSQVREAVDLVFLPPEELAQARPPAAEDEETDQPEDPPEALEGGTLDLGALAVEFLVLGLDPYPRKPDARFEGPQVEADPAEHPFAALAALKNRKNGREN